MKKFIRRQMNSLHRFKYFSVVILVAVTVWLFWFMVFNQNVVGIDDANIFKVYAQNFARGFGFVYQTGGPRVEGFTSLLYLLLLSLLYKIIGNIDLAGLMLNFSVFTLVILVSSHIIYSLNQKIGQPDTTQWSIALLITWLVSNPFFTVWLGLTQMDVGLWTLVILLALDWCLKIDISQRQLSQLMQGLAIVVLLALTRPEGMLVGGFLPLSWLSKVILASLPWRQLQLKLLMSKSFVAVCLILIWLGTVAGLTWFRLTYFGWPLPNTFYAKFSPDFWYRLGEGLAYSWSFIAHLPVLLLAIGLSIYVFIRCLKNIAQAKNFYHLVTLGFLFILFLLPIVNGGDHFAGWRIYQPAWPIIGIMLIAFLLQFPPKWWSDLVSKYSILLVCSVIFILLVISQPYLISQTRLSLNQFGYEFAIAGQGRATGNLLNSWFEAEKKPVIGVITAGGIAMTYQGEIYDLIGLNEATIAHDGGLRKGFKNHASINPVLVADKSPELLFPNAMRYEQVARATDISQVLMHNTLFAQTLFSSQSVKDQYQLVWLTQEKLTAIGIHPTAQGLVTYVRKDYLDELKKTEKFQIKEFEVTN